ncbi:MAG: ABC transporter permease, partial [Gammaproteobacteria bacterium]|nr:ABC transporter permease [Gammaproteobacteria bacterium]
PPYLLNGPALVIFTVMLVVPMVMTLILSFNSFDFYGGINADDYGWHNYLEVVQDSYFHEIFARTYGIAVAVTLICALIGAPEAYILNRMSKTWRSVCLLAILGPLLISVIVRTLGWALLIGNNGVINEMLLGIGLIETPLKMMFTTGGIVVALVHVLVPFMVLSVWTT